GGTLIEYDGSVRLLEIAQVPKDHILSNGATVIQLETAIGAAVKNFRDLLLVMSNLYIISNGNLVMNTKRLFKTTPIIQLSGPYFKTVKDFLSRFSTIPDILELDYLSVSGDVNFDKDVSLKGTVIVLAQHGDHIDIPRGSVLENKIISGNLRIVDH
ncbi:hypothetical protein MXB_4736, partial [Myxobolus squamalis]